MKRAIAVLLLCAAGCQSPKSEVLVLGTIHGGHRTEPDYSVDVLREIIRRVEPDYVLTEIPPDRIDAAWGSFTATGTIDEPRVTRFPEYVDVLFPLTREMRFTIVPCAAWTRKMADERTAKLTELRETHPQDSAVVQSHWNSIDARLVEAGLDPNDPFDIHTASYDAVVEAGLEPYDRLFNDELGAGGWTNINRAHYALIERVLDKRSGQGARFLVMFGSWHKHRILSALRERDDVELLDFPTLMVVEAGS
ncbi:MAG: hypothetical protein GY711_07505 [bacterium]|nr:hypothetical protein [bacterium]